uniref:Ethylene-insensitive 2 n=1 Tax=Solanum tuberosum TaxID=4113 RepID=M1B7J8_SOLTU
MTLASEQVQMVHVLGDAEAKAVELKTQTKKLENYCEDLASIAKKLKLQKKVLEGSSQNQEGAFHVEKALVSHPDLSTKDTDQLLPESLLDFAKVHHLATIDESKSETTFSAPAVCHPGVFVSAGAISGVKSICNEVSGVGNNLF